MDLDSGTLENVQLFYLCRTTADPEFNLTYTDVQNILTRDPDFLLLPDSDQVMRRIRGCLHEILF